MCFQGFATIDMLRYQPPCVYVLPVSFLTFSMQKLPFSSESLFGVISNGQFYAHVASREGKQRAMRGELRTLLATPAQLLAECLQSGIPMILYMAAR